MKLIQLLCTACSLLLAAAGTGIRVTATLRGKKYQLEGASVRDLQNELAEKAGLAREQQSVLFKGKLLTPDADLSASGVSDGDTINVVPTKRPKSERASGSSSSNSNSEGSGALNTAATGGFSGMGGLGSLGGLDGMPGLPPDMSPEEYQKMMAEVLNSPMMDEFFGSPEKIEESRKAILGNAMLKEAMSQLPGFSEMLDDPDKWQESMMQAKEMMESQRKGLQHDSKFKPSSADVDDLDDE